jgi:hypothetical protein
MKKMHAAFQYGSARATNGVGRSGNLIAFFAGSLTVLAI